jgi:hypothetical protein
MEDLVPKRALTFLNIKPNKNIYEVCITLAAGMEYMNLRLSQEFRRCNMRLLLSLRQRKFMSAFRALSHLTVYRRWATRTSKCPAIHDVKGKTTFRTIHYMFQLRTHSLLFSLTQQSSEILKTFLIMPDQSDAEILTTSKTIKYRDSMHIKNCLRRTK